MHPRREMAPTDTMQASMLAVTGVAKPVGEVRIEVLGVVRRKVHGGGGVVAERVEVIVVTEAIGGPRVPTAVGIFTHMSC